MDAEDLTCVKKETLGFVKMCLGIMSLWHYCLPIAICNLCSSPFWLRKLLNQEGENAVQPVPFVSLAGLLEAVVADLSCRNTRIPEKVRRTTSRLM